MSKARIDQQRHTAELEVSILGPTTVRRDGQLLDHRALGGPKPRQILEILAVRAGTPVAKDQLADLLWEGRPPQGYLGTLESYVCLLRRSLGLTGRRSGISTVLHGYLLDESAVTVDLARFRTLVGPANLTPARADDAARLTVLDRAVSLVGGELLASEPYAEWAARERDLFALELADAATEGAGCALRLAQPETAVRLARIAIARDPYAEEAWRHLIDALCGCGRRSEALRTYQELEDLLETELAARPSPATTQRYLAALSSTQGAGETSGADAHEELRVLLTLVRSTVKRVPGLDLGAVDRGLLRLAETMGAAS